MMPRLEGTWNVVRFNWPKYAFGLVMVSLLFLVALRFPPLRIHGAIIGSVGGLLLLAPLLASYVIYDRSQLARMPWLDRSDIRRPRTLLTLNAGFDGSASGLERRYPESDLTVIDFYHSQRHTEPSIAHARKAYPPHPRTISAPDGDLPMPTASVDLAVAFLALHEVREHNARVAMLREIRRVLVHDGVLVVTEHLRDVPNAMAFSIGVFHFHSRRAWMTAFQEAGFRVRWTQRTALFITTFALSPA